MSAENGISSQSCRKGGQKDGRYHPYPKCDVVSVNKSVITINGTKYKDTGGGFLLEEYNKADSQMPTVVQEEAPPVEEDRPLCLECANSFAKSWLFDQFDYRVCDNCKDTDDKHRLITKTEVMKEYLLKDHDLDKREPPLRCIKRKNPHNVRWGEMKLYLQLQVEERALQVWGSKEKLESELEDREEKKVLAKSKKYHKQMKELRMNVRSSLYNKTTAAFHQHEYGPETYNSDEDNYTHTCQTCGFEEVFEKM